MSDTSHTSEVSLKKEEQIPRDEEIAILVLSKSSQELQGHKRGAWF